MEPESNGDGEEKKDTNGKKPAEDKTEMQSKMDKASRSGLDMITQMAKGIVIDEAKALKMDTNIGIATRSKTKSLAAAGASPGSGSGSKRNKGKLLENVARSGYYLRSGKGTNIDATKPPKPKPAAGKKRIGGKLKRLQSPESDTEAACNRMKKKRDRDDDDNNDDMDATPARVTRSRSKLRRVNSL